MTRYVPIAEQSDEDKKWMLEALKMARQAFEAAEVPVGSVFVRNGQVVARARNRTNELMNATRHAELEAIDYILSQHPPEKADFPTSPHSGPAGDNPFAETTLYVTIEPCIMCASALRQVGIKRVVFGAGNERFGGNGSVLPVHTDPQLKNAPAYEAVGGYYREDAIMLLRRFYLTENVFAPNPRSKAKRVLKTYFQPPGVSMHGPTPQGGKKSSASSSSSRRRLRHASGTGTSGGIATSNGHAHDTMSPNGTPRSSTPAGGSDAGDSASGLDPFSGSGRPIPPFVLAENASSPASSPLHREQSTSEHASAQDRAQGAAAAAAAATETGSLSSVPPSIAEALDEKPASLPSSVS